jgi:hypothetical protein
MWYNFPMMGKGNSVEKEMKKMAYTKPVILAQSTVRMAECRPNSKPSGRPCNPPRPGGR